MVLGDLAKRVIVPTFSLDSQRIHPKLHMRAWKPKFFHNFPGPDSDADQRVVDVALRSTAAPTFFPVYQGFIDGGVIANNPAMCALAQATDPGTGNTPLAEIAMLSLSTGAYPKFITKRYANWGLVQWAGPLIEIFTEGSVSVAEYQCSRMLGPRFHRLNPVLPSPIGLDDLTQIRTMRQLAEEQNVEPTVAWLKEYFLSPAAEPKEEVVPVEHA
jgi:patatin-like phospholipase/acyl hydrolase